MILNSNEIRILLKHLWPELSFVWLKNTEFYAPSREALEVFLEVSQVDGIPFVSWNAECDYFALQLHAEAKRYFMDFGPVTLGEAFGDRFRGEAVSHNLNIAITNTREVLFIEPQTDGIWGADPARDNVLILTM